MSEGFIRYGSQLRVLPYLHHRIAFSIFLRRNLPETGWRPDVLALEITPSLGEPIRKAIELVGIGPIVVGKRIEDWLNRWPTSSLSGLSHTRRSSAATARVLLDARRFALSHLSRPIECDEQRWLREADFGFDPFVIVCGSRTSPTYYCNVVLPDRVHLGSEAFSGPRARRSDGLWSSQLAGRVWFTPPFYPGDRWLRAEWIKAGNAENVPPVRSRCNPGDGAWASALLRRAIEYCRRHVLYIAPADLPPEKALVDEAEAKECQVVHVPIDAVDNASLELVSHDEFELGEFHPSEMKEDTLELFALHSGDAILAATRLAVDRELSIAWIDKEISDPLELELASSRPTLGASTSGLCCVEDAFLEEEGLEAFYARIRTAAEATRIECVDADRDRHMAGRLKQLLSSDQKVLFVCGAAHWGSIQRLLDDPSLEPRPADTQCPSGDLLCAAASSVISGADEAPLTQLRYEQQVLRGSPERFDLVQASEDLRAALRRRLAEAKEISPAAIVGFETYLTRLSRQTGVVLPQVYHIVEAALSCLSPAGQHIVFQETMKFRRCPSGIPKIEIGGDGRAWVGGKSYKVYSRAGLGGYRYLPETGEVDRLDAERGLSDRPIRPGRCSPATWEQHMSEMMVAARRLAAPRIASVESVPVSDVQQGPLDMRATARARVRGDGSIYQRVVNRALVTSLSEFEGFDPIVWQFEDEVSRFLVPLYLDGFDDVPGVIAANTTDLANGNRRYQFQLFASWIPRFADTDPVTRRRIRRWLAQGNTRFVPTRKSFRDAVTGEGGDGLSAAEKMLILGLAHCREHVICVSRKTPSDGIRSRFRKRRKRLLHVSIGLFGEKDLSNLRTATFGRWFVP